MTGRFVEKGGQLKLGTHLRLTNENTRRSYFPIYGRSRPRKNLMSSRRTMSSLRCCRSEAAAERLIYGDQGERANERVGGVQLFGSAYPLARDADTQLPMAAKGAKPINLQHGLHGATQGVHELCYRDIRVVYCIIYFHKRSLKDPFYIFAPVGFWKTTRRTFFSKISFHPTPPHPVGSALIQCLSKLARDTRPTTRRGVRVMI